MDLRSELTNRRKELGLTLAETAKLVGVSEATVSRWESGHIDNMKRDKIALLAKALQVSPLFIMGMNEKSDNEIESDEKSPIFLISKDKNENQATPNTQLSKQNETDIVAIIEQIKERLTQDNLTFKGKPVNTEDVQSLISALQVGMEMTRNRMDKK